MCSLIEFTFHGDVYKGILSPGWDADFEGVQLAFQLSNAVIW